MKFKSTVFLALLLFIHTEFHTVSSNPATNPKAVSNSESVLASSNDAQQNNPDRFNRSKIQFNNLIEDVQYLILYHMNLTELVQMAQTNSRMYSMAKEVFAHKYRDHTIDISSNGLHRPHHKRVIITDINSAESILKYFGSLIKKLAIVNSTFTKSVSKALCKLVNEYVLGTVTHLDLDFLKEDTLQQFTSPFNEVEELNILLFENIYHENTMPLNQMFPKLRSLFIGALGGTDYKLIDLNFPNLFYININLNNIFHQREQVKSFLQKNKQIKHVESMYCPYYFMCELHEILPDIELLTLTDNIKGLSQPLRFERMKHFKTKSRSIEQLHLLEFPHLQSFDVRCDDDNFDALKNYLSNIRNISKFHISAHMSIDERITQLTDELPNLTEFSIECFNQHLPAEVIAQIIQSHDNLDKFEVTVYRKYSESIIKHFHELAENDWRVTDMIVVEDPYVVKFTVEKFERNIKMDEMI